MWILRYLILATRQRSNALLDRRTRMIFDALHGCPMHVCRDKDEWDRRGKDQVALLESELRQDIEAYNTVTHERRVIAGEMIEVRPVMLEKPPEALEAFKEFLGATESLEETEKILPEAAPEMEAETAPTGDALVSSGVEAQAEAEPGAEPTTLEQAETEERTERTERTQGTPEEEPEAEADRSRAAARQTAEGSPEGERERINVRAPLEVPASSVPTVPTTPKTKTKPAGKAGKK